ncbi:MAG TPA: hypothetical protein VEZ55_08965 [Chitinophagaceae bacterium]|jgi:hypothetical protein|nr:hypothetical protein [Chitinophagaceae bacterium]
MKSLFFLLPLTLLLAYCTNDNKGGAQSKVFCDTTCSNDSFNFKGNHKMNPFVWISSENCTADTITWSYDYLQADRQMHMGTLLGNLVRLNREALSCYFKDTSYAWLTFNDCLTGRGYLIQLVYDKSKSVRKMSSAINSFDKKFVLPDNLRAYCDYSTIYVEDITKDKKELMTFKEEYKIDFNNIHETIDSVNITNNRIFVQLIKDGQKVPLEKQINL